jgi:hypothetical protein
MLICNSVKFNEKSESGEKKMKKKNVLGLELAFY